MNRKKIIAAVSVLILLAVGIWCFLWGSGAEPITGVKKASIEVLEPSGTVREIPMNSSKDRKAIEQILSREEAARDSGFVFAEGGYRIVLETEQETFYLYPYCGDPDLIRIGAKGDEYYDFADEPEKGEQLANILGEYCNLEDYQGVFDWPDGV